MLDRIPNYTALRRGKTGYDTKYPIDTANPLYSDPLVDPREFDEHFADASSYYSKPNRMTGEALPGVPDAPLVRLDVMKRVKRAETWLNTDREVRDMLGAPAHIVIDDGLRPLQVQEFAWSVAWPSIIRKMNPEQFSDPSIPIPEEILTKYVAKPGSTDTVTPTPHLTGGALDVGLASLETGEKFNRGHAGGAIKGTAYPDFHEGYHLVDGESDIQNVAGQAEIAKESSEVMNYRRILYHAMTKVAGLYVNPTEIWHYGIGDPLSAYVSGGAFQPYYDVADLPDWYIAQMKQLQNK